MHQVKTSNTSKTRRVLVGITATVVTATTLAFGGATPASAVAAPKHCGRTGYSLFLHLKTGNGLDQKYFFKTLSHDRLAICLEDKNVTGKKHKIGEDVKRPGKAWSNKTTAKKSIGRELVLKPGQEGKFRSRFRGQKWVDSFRGA